MPPKRSRGSGGNASRTTNGAGKSEPAQCASPAEQRRGMAGQKNRDMARHGMV